MFWLRSKHKEGTADKHGEQKQKYKDQFARQILCIAENVATSTTHVDLSGFLLLLVAVPVSCNGSIYHVEKP